MATSLYETLKADIKKYRLEKETAKLNILKVIVGELSTKEKNGEEITDAVVVSYLKKVVGNNDKVITALPGGDPRVEKLTIESDTIKGYYPRMLTEQQVNSILNEYKFKTIKDAMTFFKANYAGQYDAGALAKRYAK